MLASFWFFSNGIACLCLEPIACYKKACSEANQAVAIQFF
jgi:hypothetical protein